MNGRFYFGAAFILLAVLGCELFFSSREQSQAFDEADHLYAGVEYWRKGDFGRNPEHPPLVKLVAAAPVAGLAVPEPAASPIPYFKMQDFIERSKFLYSADANALLLRSRMAVAAVFTLGLALLVFAAAGEMFNRQVAIIALLLFVFEPVVLANGALVTTDIGVACLLFASVYSFYRYVKRPSALRLAICWQLRDLRW